MPGSGKSTVGRHVARHLGLPFVDTDHEIDRRIGCSIREFFELRGEPAFRDVEADVINEVLGGSGLPRVVATGGGAVLREANRHQLHRSFHVIYLRSSPEDLFRRLRHDVKRPLLQVQDPLGRLRELHTARDPLYRETAHDIVDTGRPTVAMLVNLIVMQLELAGIAVPPPDDAPV